MWFIAKLRFVRVGNRSISRKDQASDAESASSQHVATGDFRWCGIDWFLAHYSMPPHDAASETAGSCRCYGRAPNLEFILNVMASPVRFNLSCCEVNASRPPSISIIAAEPGAAVKICKV
jgi:hypothetical protein